MQKQIFIPIILLLWAGMILGIALEASVKFKTPSLTKAAGLDVGRTVFRTFQKTQWGLWTLLFLIILFKPSFSYLIISLSLGILLWLQTYWLFPKLCAQIELFLIQKNPAKSPYHKWYALLEMGKLLLLIGSSFYFFL